MLPLSAACKPTAVVAELEKRVERLEMEKLELVKVCSFSYLTRPFSAQS